MMWSIKPKWRHGDAAHNEEPGSPAPASPPVPCEKPVVPLGERTIGALPIALALPHFLRLPGPSALTFYAGLRSRKR